MALYPIQPYQSSVLFVPLVPPFGLLAYYLFLPLQIVIKAIFGGVQVAEPLDRAGVEVLAVAAVVAVGFLHRSDPRKPKADKNGRLCDHISCHAMS
jgi:hypothetical protein